MLELDEIQAPKPVKLFVATPMYGGLCTGGYTMGILECVQTFMPHKIQMYYSYMMNESLITRARNGMAYDFLQSDASHLMFIDADISFNPKDIVRMVKADKDIICGLYPKKEINWKLVHDAVKQGVDYKDLGNYTGSFVVNLVGGALETEGNINNPMEIDNGGTGFMLIKRNVFETLQPTVPKYTNDMIHITDKNPKKKIVDEFRAVQGKPVDIGGYYSADSEKCKVVMRPSATFNAALKAARAPGLHGPRNSCPLFEV
jgi:hypothetical protein